MSKTLRNVILYGAPLFVGIINIFHPVHFEPTGVYEALHDHVGWWITLHILNLFGFPLLAVAAYLWIDGEKGLPARVARIALAIFVPTYAGFDSIIGIGTGNLIQYAKTLQLDQLPIVESVIDAYWSNSVATGLAIAGSVAWSIGIFAIAVHFAAPKRRMALVVLSAVAGAFIGWGYSSSSFGSLPWWIGVAAIGLITYVLSRPSPIPALLFLAGILFGTTHVVPYGPLGMACFVSAIALTEFAGSKAMPAVAATSRT